MSLRTRWLLGLGVWAMCSFIEGLAPERARAAESAAFQPPVPVTRRLPNGLTVAVFQNDRLPIVQIQLLVPAGSAADPPNLGGAARMTADLLRRGTSSRSAEAFSEQLDRLGGSMGAIATRDHSIIDGRFLARDLEVGIELMSDAVINPLLDEDQLRRAKSATAAALMQTLRDPSNVADEQLWLAVFEGRPYGRPPYGTPESLQRLTADQVRAFYFAHYRPGEATLAIAGDVTPQRAFAAAEEWFGRWEDKGAAPEPATPEAAPSARARIRVVDAPGLHEVQLRVGLAGPPRGSSDELAFSIATVRLGGGASSRLAGLRERGTLRREVRSTYLPLKQAGLLLCGTTAAEDSVGAALAALQAELRRLVTEPPDEAELAPVRHTVANTFPMQFETLGGILGHWLGARFRGSTESGESFAERVESRTAAEVAAAIRRSVRPEAISVVVVGPAAQIRAQLEPFGSVSVVRLDGAAVVTPEAPSAETPPTSAEVARGRRIVKQAAAAHGGLERLRGIKDSTVEADATLVIGPQEVQGQFIQIRKEPYRMIFTTSFGGLDTHQILNGDQGWSTAGLDVTEMSLDSLSVAAMRAGFTSDLPHLLVAAAAPAARVASRGRERIDDRDADQVELVTAGSRRTLYFDATTHRLLAMDQHETRGSQGFMSRRVYRDYRPVKGIQWPHVEERLMDGQRIMTLKFTKVLLNTGVDDSIFEKPEAPLSPPAR